MVPALAAQAQAQGPSPHEAAKPPTKSALKAFYDTLSTRERIVLVVACALAMVSAAALIATIIVFPPVGVVAMGAIGLSAETLVMVTGVTAIATSIISTCLITLVDITSGESVKFVITKKINRAVLLLKDHVRTVNHAAVTLRDATIAGTPAEKLACLLVRRTKLERELSKLAALRDNLSSLRTRAAECFSDTPALRAPYIPPVAATELNDACAEFNARHDAPHAHRIAAAERVINAATVVRDALLPHNLVCARRALLTELDAVIAAMNAEIDHKRSLSEYAELVLPPSAVGANHARRGSF